MEELITTKQVQELLRVDRITVYRMLKDGRLTGLKVGKQWRFSQQEIQDFINGKEKPRPQPYDPEKVLPVHCINVMQDVFAEMLNIGSVTTDVEGTPITEISNSCQFCNLILSSPIGKQNCINDWKRLAGTPKGDPKFFECHAGFQYARGRIEVEGILTAVLIAGQFLISQPEQGDLATHIKNIAEKYQIDPDELSAAATDLRILPYDEQQQIGKWLKRVAHTFEMIAHERADLLGRLKHIAAMTSFD